MKKIISMILTLAIVVSIVFSNPFSMDVNAATSGTTGDCTWTLEGTVLRISGYGKMADHPFQFMGESDRNEITEVIIENGVTNIADEAFFWFQNLSHIEMPSSIKEIGAYAFHGCSSLSDVDLPEGLISIEDGAFSLCSSLTRIDIPESLTFLGNDAFGGCENLHSVYIKDLFQYCNIEIDATDDPYGSGLSAKKLYLNNVLITNLAIPVGITKINEGLFMRNESLISVEIPEGVTEIGDYAFYGCTNLTSVIIPKGVENIGALAFSGCEELSTLELPNGVINIGYMAFSWCQQLSSVSISKSVKKMGCRVFYECTNLESVYIEDLSAWCGISFEHEQSTYFSANPLVYAKKLYVNGELITHFVIPEGIESIEDYAFMFCVNMKSIELPSTLKSVGCDAFSHCTGLKDVWYHGRETKRENISILDGCDYLENAEWHYSCDENRHLYSWNSNLTCKYCGYSQKPPKPELESQERGIVTLVANEGMEYSKDDINWQDSNVFTNLSGDTTYTFYQRVKASTSAQVSATSEGLDIYIKIFQDTPAAPTISSYTDTTITLLTLANGEYSLDGTIWQQSNVFENLLAGTEYTFYQRYAETDTHEASEASTGTSVTTDKSKQTSIPTAPTVQSVTSSSITLIAVEGCEYSKNGTTWQSSNVFSGLSCGMEYTFCQRYKETSSTYAGKSSEGTIGKTDKGTQSAPSKPELSTKTHNSVTLVEKSGYEYSMDGITWQTSNIFTGLNPETNYLFYQRKAETETHYASEASISLTIKTDEEPTYIVGDLDGDFELSDWDGVILARYLAGWQVEISALEALDIDGDGEVSDWDGVVLDRYLAGWNIQIGGQS